MTGRWLRHWLVGRVSLRPNTRRMYESHLRLYLLPHLDRIPLSGLTIGERRAVFLTISRQAPGAGQTPVGADAAQHPVHVAGGSERRDPGRVGHRRPGSLG